MNDSNYCTKPSSDPPGTSSSAIVSSNASGSRSTSSDVQNDDGEEDAESSSLSSTPVELSFDLGESSQNHTRSSDTLHETERGFYNQLESFRNEWKQEIQRRCSPADRLVGSTVSERQSRSATERLVREVSELSLSGDLDLIDCQLPQDLSLAEQFEKQRLEDPDWEYFPKEFECSNRLHLSDLPAEIVIYILRWVVGSDLDYRSLDRLACVCKGLYLLSMDQHLWRDIAHQIWGISKGTRHMVLNRPHPVFDGVYVSRATYVRIGEPEINKHNPPCYLIEYFRYVRFFPPQEPLRGRVVMLTSNDAPEEELPNLMNESNLLEGTYCFDCPATDRQPSHIKCTFETTSVSIPPKHQFRRRQHQQPSEVRKKIYICEFELKRGKSGKRKNHMIWRRYEIHQYSSLSKELQVTDFAVSDTKSFPPFEFYYVRSYSNQCSEMPV